MAYLTHQQGPLRPVYDGAMPAGGYVGEPGQAMTPGTGLAGTGTVYLAWVDASGPIIKTTIYLNLKGLKSGASAGDIIGVNATANCHLGQVTTAINGKIFKGSFSCLTIPATGEPDIDVATGTVATGTQDAAASGLTGYVLNLDHAADFTAAGQSLAFTTAPAADTYLYLVASGGADTAVYTAGEVVIELWGYRV